MKKRSVEATLSHQAPLSHELYYPQPFSMHLQDLLGQLFILGFHGDSLQPGTPIAEDIVERNLGGVILFDRFLSQPPDCSNITSLAQLTSLCTQLQELASTPLFISVDQEGGMVRRLKEQHGFPPLPSAAETGLDPSFQTTDMAAKTTAETLLQVGINVNFAPVADLNITKDNPVIGLLGRSFAKDPAIVSEHCRIWLERLHQAGILGCLKHFPGHGSSQRDSHLDFVDISESWQEIELEPYRHLIASGQVKAIMIGHLFHAGFDTVYPASLSFSIIDGLLRRQLGFEGLVVSDDLQMQAIANHYGPFEAITLALRAGVDLIILGNNLIYTPDVLDQAIRHIENCLRRGELSEDTLVNAYNRVSHYKELYL